MEITNRNSYQRETDHFLSLMLQNALYYLRSHSIVDYIIYQGHQCNAKKAVSILYRFLHKSTVRETSKYSWSILSKRKQDTKEKKAKKKKGMDSLNATTISLVLNTSITPSDERLNIQVFSMLILCKFFCIFSSAKCLNFNYILAFEAWYMCM